MTAAPSMPPEIARKISWRLGPLMILMYMANQLDRANIGYAALTMNQELGLSAAQYGLAASLFFIGYVLFEVPSNLCMYRFGARLWMTRIMVTWGIVSSLTCLVPSAQWLYVARFVLGVFEAGLFPGMVFYLTLWLPAKDRVWMMSLFVTAIPLTGVFGAPISTWLMEHASIFSLSGWRAMIFLEGIPSIALGIFVFFYLPDGPAKARWLTAAERTTVASVLSLEQKQREGLDRRIVFIFVSGCRACVGATNVLYALESAPPVVLGQASTAARPVGCSTHNWFDGADIDFTFCFPRAPISRNRASLAFLGASGNAKRCVMTATG